MFEPIYRYVFFRTGGVEAETEDVVQETFLAALEGVGRFRGESSLFTWLCAIARNRLSKRRRQRARERIATTLEAIDPAIQGMLARLDEGALSDEALAREETEELVGATMASLPPDYQELLVDKYVHAQPVREIARRRGRTAKAVESTLSRAREAFRRTFALLRRGVEGPRHG